MLMRSTYILATALILMPTMANACGSAAQQFWSYILESDRATLESFLDSQQCSGDLKYSPDAADPYVALVLINAARAGVDKGVFENVLSRFNCVAQLSNRSGYQTIVDYVGEERFGELCKEENHRRVYVVSADGGANLRKTPSIDGQKIGAVGNGAVAVDGIRDGEWIKVTTYLGEGYMHESTLRPYLPPSD